MFKKHQIFLNTDDDYEEKSQASMSSSMSDYDDNYMIQHGGYIIDNEQIKDYISAKKKQLNEKKQKDETSERKKRTSYSLPHRSYNTTVETESSQKKNFENRNINQYNLAEIGQVYESKQAYEDWMNQISNQKMVKIDFDQQTTKKAQGGGAGGKSQINSFFNERIEKMNNQLLHLKNKIINDQKMQYYANIKRSEEKTQQKDLHQKKADISFRKQFSLDENQKKQNQEEILKKCEQPKGFFDYKTYFHFLPSSKSPIQRTKNPLNKSEMLSSADKKTQKQKQVKQSDQQQQYIQNIRQYSQTPKQPIDRVFEESFYPRKSTRKESSVMSSYDAQNQQNIKGDSPLSKKLMHTLDRRLQFLNKVQVKSDGLGNNYTPMGIAAHNPNFNFGSVNEILNYNDSSSLTFPERNSPASKKFQSLDFPQFQSVILPSLGNRDKNNNQNPNQIKQIQQTYSTKNQIEQNKRFILKEEFLEGYSINESQMMSQHQQSSFSPAQRDKKKFMSIHSSQRNQKSPHSSSKKTTHTPQYQNNSQLIQNNNSYDQSICYIDQNHNSTLSLNYQGKPLDANQVKQIPQVINELSTIIDGTFKEGKKFDDPQVLSVFYKSIRQIIEMDLSHLEELKLDKNNKNKLHQFNEKIKTLKDKLQKLIGVQLQIEKTILINDEMLQSQKRLIKIKKSYDKTLDNIDFFMQILEQYDYPESNTSMVMLKMKQNEFKELIDLQHQSASEYRECMLDPSNPANSITAYRYDRIRKIKEFIKQKKIRNAQKLTNF
ncbi:hypothetical protein TTHERM_00602910 (macronuclear) [Tetrahymena thermophila SB210]|uniref:Uncharacterized protein n=1 Tax=Tetrahymena thermophila (strain SB210) TaxID=312017 RepID=Q22YK4_TETTS|nr:hypothetical protein TTHERM_00602910 [Tetrahymena thermophila SB210]EAR90281.2 hypothetical protein TTHERM_00602910 [Tetrahymena thermophila SB210]|eukprot:XP_001010526.2 hypothetical protein TTHERM_00602910 [Tetrahymena thermophila SB210]